MAKKKTPEVEQTWITRAEGARRLGVSKTMVSRYCHQGAPTREDRKIPWPSFKGWVDANVVHEASGSWASRQRGEKGEPAAAVKAPTRKRESAAGHNFLTAKTRREMAGAEMAELKLLQAKAGLIAVTDVKRIVFSMGKMHSAARENLPVHVAPLLIGKSDLGEIEDILRRELRARDEQIANELEARHAELFGKNGEAEASLEVNP